MSKLKNFSSNRAITLIALIVTIIVMLILVAVSINIIVDSDLIGAAEKTADKYKTEYEKEQTLGQVTIGNKTYASINEYLNNNPISGGDDLDGGDGDEMPVITAGVRATEPSTYSDGTDTAVIPAKFTVSGAGTEKTISGGLVIYLIDDKTDEEIAAIDWEEDLATLKTTYDQFVWIPIKNTTDANAQDINDMYICQNKGTGGYGTTACVITVPDATGVATCSTHGNCTAMAGRLYATEDDNYNAVYTSGSGLREPDVVTGNSAGDGTSRDGAYTETSGVKTYTNLNTIKTILGDNTNYENLTTWKSELQREYNNIVKSVYINQGFYVGRYETSGMVQATSGYDVAVVAGVLPSVETDWYHMYAQQKKYASSNSLEVGSTMIQGAAYDQVMKFVNTADYSVTSGEEVGHSFTSRYNTGSQSGDESKNIFDLEGNVCAWTTEADDTSRRVDRGRPLRRQLFGEFSQQLHSGRQQLSAGQPLQRPRFVVPALLVMLKAVKG